MFGTIGTPLTALNEIRVSSTDALLVDRIDFWP